MLSIAMVVGCRCEWLRQSQREVCLNDVLVRSLALLLLLQQPLFLLLLGTRLSPLRLVCQSSPRCCGLLLTSGRLDCCHCCSQYDGRYAVVPVRKKDARSRWLSYVGRMLTVFVVVTMVVPVLLCLEPGRPSVQCRLVASSFVIVLAVRYRSRV